MKLQAIKIITIVASLTVFIISLTKHAVIIDYQDVAAVGSLDYFLMGSTAILGGAFLEQLIWLANPLSLFAIFLLIANKRSAMWVSLIALLLAFSFSYWKRILGAESGAMADILSFELGYYLWVLSILILMVGSCVYFKVEALGKGSTTIQQ